MHSENRRWRRCGPRCEKLWVQRRSLDGSGSLLSLLSLLGEDLASGRASKALAMGLTVGLSLAVACGALGLAQRAHRVRGVEPVGVGKHFGCSRRGAVETCERARGRRHRGEGLATSVASPLLLAVAQQSVQRQCGSGGLSGTALAAWSRPLFRLAWRWRLRARPQVILTPSYMVLAGQVRLPYARSVVCQVRFAVLAVVPCHGWSSIYNDEP